MYIAIASGKVKTIQAASTIASIQYGSPYVVKTTAAHDLETGDMVQLSPLPGLTFTTTVIDSETFSLNETANGGLIWTPVSGSVTHVGYATAAVATDGTQIPPGTNFSMHFSINTLNAGYIRCEFEDSDEASFNDRLPGPSFCSPAAPITSGDSYSAPVSQWPGMYISGTGDVMRCKVFLNGGPGASANFSAFLG